MSEEKWVPLESNPEVMTEFVKRLGVPGGWSFVDVMGLEGEALTWVPRPVVAVLMLFPCSDRYEAYKREQEERLMFEPNSLPPNVFFARQKVRNACGAVALVHAVANNADRLDLADGPFKNFIEETAKLDADAKGERLVRCGAIVSAQRELASEGQTPDPDADEPSYHHFLTLVHCCGRLIELDGRKPEPVDHGSTDRDNLLEDAARVCREYVAREPREFGFSVMALAKEG